MDLIIKNGREQYINPHKLSKYPKIFIGIDIHLINLN